LRIWMYRHERRYENLRPEKAMVDSKFLTNFGELKRVARGIDPKEFHIFSDE
jgi:hypothetical protein